MLALSWSFSSAVIVSGLVILLISRCLGAARPGGLYELSLDG
jgi:hypothetical protein